MKKDADNTRALEALSKSNLERNDPASTFPLVSIIICGHNYGEYLPDAIESAFKQTYKNIEIIAVDDGSTDNTEEVLKKYGIKRIFQKHQGLAAARNNGIKNSKGSFFLCLDGDDKIAPRHIEETTKTMLKNPKIGFVTTGSKIWYEENGLENIWMPRKILFRYSVFAGWVAALGTVLMRRTAFEGLSAGFDSSLPAHEDLDICFRLLKNWKSDLVFEPLHWYRRHKVVLDSQTIETRRIAAMSLDRKYPYRELYRTIHKVYKITFGRLVSFVNHPVKYLKAVQKKTQLNIQLRQYNLKNKPEIKEYAKQIFDTLDMQVEWSRNKDLFLYYNKRIELLKSLIFSPTNVIR
jgi:glycosyltransferase involved in cell wall biosynthesis